MDMNRNQLCDDDEPKGGFAEPTYTAPEEIANSHINLEEDEAKYEAYEYTNEDRYEEPTPVAITKEDLPEPIQKPKAVYTSPEPELTGWFAENDIMSLKITKIVIENRSIKPKDLISPDYEVYLKEIHLTMTDKRYGEPYLIPKFKIKIGDSFDPMIIIETLKCDSSDDIIMEGCKSALKDTESADIIMYVNTKITRPEINKNFYFELENKRDTTSDMRLIIEKQYNILSIPGAIYT